MIVASVLKYLIRKVIFHESIITNNELRDITKSIDSKYTCLHILKSKPRSLYLIFCFSVFASGWRNFSSETIQTNHLDICRKKLQIELRQNSNANIFQDKKIDLILFHWCVFLYCVYPVPKIFDFFRLKNEIKRNRQISRIVFRNTSSFRFIFLLFWSSSNIHVFLFEKKNCFMWSTMHLIFCVKTIRSLLHRGRILLSDWIKLSEFDIKV